MTRQFDTAPSAEEIEEIAQAAMQRLGEPFRGHLDEIVLKIEDFADDATLAAMGLEDPFELTGLYEGVPLTEKSVEQSGVLPPVVRLFRRPMLDEWADNGDVTLEHLVHHVIIHELGHHFGLSDEDIHALEAQA